MTKQKKISMNWALHLHLLDWLYHHPKLNLDTSHVLELMTIAAARWANDIMNYPRAKGILLASPYFEKKVIGVWRNTTVENNAQIIQYKISTAYFPPSLSYAISYQQDVWGVPVWNELPK